MKVKIFTPDSNGRISFTKKELQTLLDEVYKEGYEDARPHYWTWYPYQYVTNATTTSNPQITWTADSTTCTNSITASNSDGHNTITIPKPEDYKVEFK